jgi:hypothetical protein
VVVMVMMDFTRCHEGRHSVLVADGVTPDFTATAYALIRLNVRTGSDFLQENLDRLFAFRAFEGQETRRFVSHDDPRID